MSVIGLVIEAGSPGNFKDKLLPVPPLTRLYVDLWHSMVMGRDREDSGPPPAILEMNHVFEALAHPRRRYLLYTLLDDTEWLLQELAEKVAAWENDVPESTLYDDEVERVYVSLYHNHVPKLVEDEIVVFEEPTETIRPGPHAEQVLAVLENAGGSHDSEQEAHARSDSDEGHP